KGGLRWKWSKTDPIFVELAVTVPDELGEFVYGAAEFGQILAEVGADGLSAEVRARVAGRSITSRFVEITLVNTSNELVEFADGRFFECSVEVARFARRDFELEALPDSFRFDRRVA